MKLIKADHDDLKMPDVGQFLYIVEMATELGMHNKGSSICWGDILEWQKATGITVEPWEARMLMKMSQWFVAAVREYHGVSVSSPKQQARGVRPSVEAMKRAFRGLRGDQ